MGNFTKLMVLAATAALASCSTGPAPVSVAAAPPPAPASNLPYKWTLGNAPQAYEDMKATFGRTNLKTGEYVWTASIPEGETRVVIDRLIQVAYVYRGDKLVGATTVSTARQGYITPLGEWTVLEKRPFYRSKKYDNAPMPFMQRIDEYGIALHGGGTPGRPESHGCIHLPNKFAQKLFGLTRIGSKVIIEG